MCPAIPAAATSDAPALVLAQCRHNRRQHDNWFGAFTFPMVSADSVRKDQLIVMTFSRQGIGGEEKLPFLPPLPEHPWLGFYPLCFLLHPDRTLCSLPLLSPRKAMVWPSSTFTATAVSRASVFSRRGAASKGIRLAMGLGVWSEPQGYAYRVSFWGEERTEKSVQKNRYNSEVESPGTRTYVNTGRNTACSKALTHKTCRLHAARYRPTERQNKSSPHTASILPSYVRLLKINSTALCKNSQPSVPDSSLPAWPNRLVLNSKGKRIRAANLFTGCMCQLVYYLYVQKEDIPLCFFFALNNKPAWHQAEELAPPWVILFSSNFGLFLYF